jgi:hypothetical protein
MQTFPKHQRPRTQKRWGSGERTSVAWCPVGATGGYHEFHNHELRTGRGPYATSSSCRCQRLTCGVQHDVTHKEPQRTRRGGGGGASLWPGVEQLTSRSAVAILALQNQSDGAPGSRAHMHNSELSPTRPHASLAHMHLSQPRDEGWGR